MALSVEAEVPLLKRHLSETFRDPTSFQIASWHTRLALPLLTFIPWYLREIGSRAPRDSQLCRCSSLTQNGVEW